MAEHYRQLTSKDPIAAKIRSYWGPIAAAAEAGDEAARAKLLANRSRVRRTLGQPDQDATAVTKDIQNGADWKQFAKCAKMNMDPDEFFVQGAQQNRIKMNCVGCHVLLECRTSALENREEFGVWGGLTERERRAMLRRRAGSTSSYSSIKPDAGTTIEQIHKDQAKGVLLYSHLPEGEIAARTGLSISAVKSLLGKKQ